MPDSITARAHGTLTMRTAARLGIGTEESSGGGKIGEDGAEAEFSFSLSQSLCWRANEFGWP